MVGLRFVLRSGRCAANNHAPDEHKHAGREQQVHPPRCAHRKRHTGPDEQHHDGGNGIEVHAIFGLRAVRRR